MNNIIDWEKNSYWFFRLNGCLTIVNFIVHPALGRPQKIESDLFDTYSAQRTDADILLVRFPYRREFDMVDHEIFPKNQKRIFIGIAEVKSGICRLNGPWVKEERRNIHRVLRAIGVFPEDMVDSVAKSLYEETYFKDSNYIVRLIAIGKAKNPEYDSKYPELLQLTYESDILPFIYNRFRKYLYQKPSRTPSDRYRA